MNDTPVRRNRHAYFMQRAMELARRGWYTTRPNPRVGCVIVAGDVVIGEGWHAVAGEAHAERAALADARRRGADVRASTVYVTLEPCSHTGRTPPCVAALIEAGVARVVIGAMDPNPRVDGAGAAALAAAGIEVIADIEARRCAALNAGFERRVRSGRPRVRVKLAMSVDGRTAAANGESRWITGEAARADVHRLRAECGAVMVGRGTRAADDPSLNVRLPGDWLQPLRVVLDTHLQTPPTAAMLELTGKTLIVTASDNRDRVSALEAAGASVEQVAARDGRVDLGAALDVLGAREINDLLVEAGPTLAGALARAGLVDEYLIYMAPLLIGDGGRGLLDLGGERLADARELTIDAVTPIGGDWRIAARPRARDKGPT